MTAATAILDRLAARRRVAARIMIVVAHPDDETIGLGAQLCRFQDALLVHVTDGAPRDGSDAVDYGFASVADYAAARQAELAAALRAGEAERVRRLALGVADKEAVRDLVRLSRHIAELLRSEQPAAVFTHAYEGGHPDHDAAAFAVQAACRVVKAPPVIVEMPFYHRGGGRFVTGKFLTPASRRKPGLTNSSAESLTSGSRLSPGLREWVFALGQDNVDRKLRMIDCFATQRWLLEQFDAATERFRVAPEYDFAAPPHPGELHYETLGWGITGAEWRNAAAKAQRTLGIATPASRRKPGPTFPANERVTGGSRLSPGRQL